MWIESGFREIKINWIGAPNLGDSNCHGIRVQWWTGADAWRAVAEFSAIARAFVGEGVVCWVFVYHCAGVL